MRFGKLSILVNCPVNYNWQQTYYIVRTSKLNAKCSSAGDLTRKQRYQIFKCVKVQAY